MKIDQQSSSLLFQLQEKERHITTFTSAREYLHIETEMSNVALKKILCEHQQEFELLEAGHEPLMKCLAEVKQRLSALEARDNSMSVREAMRILERHICFNAVGKSISAFKKYFCLSKIDDSAPKDIKELLISELAKLGLTQEHLDEIAFLKEFGDYAVRPTMTIADWQREILGCSSCEESETDSSSGEKAIRIRLLEALLTYVKVAEDSGHVMIEGPIAISKKH